MPDVAPEELSPRAVATISAEAAAIMPEELLLGSGQGNPPIGQFFPLAQPLVMLGRRETNTIVVPEQAVSRAHAEIRREGSTYVLRDLGSASGTYLNCTQFAGEQRLRAGDVVGLGPGVTFTVRVATIGE